ncbi:DUF3710 domain-containing protein [Nocardioides sp. GY 10127]|uniref:DUF3710 domain-containing protein n=1 Tax=Nocardioides sp. GY 10127 TaxID=2569762 RepID=UPI0010A90ED5|nr:DUF3710 domain-containing protein [Nocardioides sp. GY 10127]TIC86631.1 DUF3710 domain-containing protein [Nocardioides sp. GY 10127]
MRFRRKQAAEPQTDEATGAVEAAEAADGGADGDARPEQQRGPFDVDDMPEPPANVTRVDLGSLLVLPVSGTELRLQVDEASGEVQAVILAGPDGALELRAFAAPRNGDLWSEVRPQIAADMQRRGGTVEEREGRFGPELQCEVRRTMPDGREAVQPSRIIGVNGSRWLLRATFIGGAARTPEAAARWEAILSTVAVRRGAGAMPVGEALPLVLPENARPTGQRPVAAGAPAPHQHTHSHPRVRNVGKKPEPPTEG